MKTFEVVYTLPSHLVTDNDLGKSLHFHRFMRHARECHKNLLEFLMQDGLLQDVGGSTLIANERKTLLECTESVVARVRTLPFIEAAQESAAAEMQSPGRRQRPGVTAR